MRYSKCNVHHCLTYILFKDNLRVCSSIHASQNLEELSDIRKCDVINGNLIINNIEVKFSPLNIFFKIFKIVSKIGETPLIDLKCKILI